MAQVSYSTDAFDNVTWNTANTEARFNHVQGDGDGVLPTYFNTQMISAAHAIAQEMRLLGIQEKLPLLAGFLWSTLT